jgi:hypothetical protein
MTSIASVTVASITLFRSCANLGRAINDSSNKIRETVLEEIVTLSDQYGPNPAYGAEWLSLKAAWDSAIRSISPINGPFTYEVKRMGGRQHNYDFLVTYKAIVEHTPPAKNTRLAALLAASAKRRAAIPHELKIEFKHGVTNISKMPQFLSLPANAELFGTSYAEFYYDNYLPAYLATDPDFPHTILDRDLYMRSIYQNNYDKNPFFRALYNSESIKKSEKAAIVNRSVKAYLEGLRTIDLETLSARFESTQRDKHYLMWDTQTFHHAEFKPEDLRLTAFESIKNGNTLVFVSETMRFSCLLRWRNHKGILLPAWQIKAAPIAAKTRGKRTPAPSSTEPRCPQTSE